MKIRFDDHSFIAADESPRNDKSAIITLCSFNPDLKKLTMSSSELDEGQLMELVDFLRTLLKKG